MINYYHKITEEKTKKLPSHKPIPLHWGRDLTKQEHYECYMLRQAGCDCDFPELKHVGRNDGFRNVVKCNHCGTYAELYKNHVDEYKSEK